MLQFLQRVCSGINIPQDHTKYYYDSDWEDQLEEIVTVNYDTNGNVVSETSVQEYYYDDQGNADYISDFYYEGTHYHHAVLTYSGRQLDSISIWNSSLEQPVNLVAYISYTYNDQGYRISKTINNNTIEYFLSGSTVLYETDELYAIIYSYDYNGSLIGFTYDPNVNVSNDEEDYFYVLDLLGNVTKILDDDGVIVVEYSYDSWGNILSVDDSSTNDIISSVNSYTYRSYRYDSEINMYYLNSRFYNPEVGRFINADGILGEVGNVLSTNMYAYCANNPVMYVDPSGEFFVLACIAMGAIIGGSLAYKFASEAGYEGLDLVVLTVLGAIGGGIGGYLAATIIPIFLQSSFTIGLPTFSMSGGTLAITTSAISVTGAQIATTIGSVIAIDIVYRASNGRPSNNQAQNKQLRQVLQKLRITDKDIIRQIHEALHNEAPMGYEELLEFVKWFIGA